MKLKTIWVLTLLLLSGISASAQDYKENIETRFYEYLNSLTDKNFEKSMNYILPEFFELVPKDQMIKLMEQTFNNPAMVFELKNPKILSVGDAEKIEGKYYSYITYSNQMNIKMIEEEPETEDEKKARISKLQSAFEETFGAKNVKYNEQTGFFEIYVEKPSYAISANGKTDWKFLVVEKKQKVLLEKLLPKELVDKI